MDNVLKYKGYSARVEYSAEDRILYGKIEGIADLVNFESETAEGIELAFREAVDDYLAYCSAIGKSPDREYKGTFNVRVSPQLHRKLDQEAYRKGISMNQFIEEALTEHLDRSMQDRDAAYLHGYECAEGTAWGRAAQVAYWENSPAKKSLNKVKSGLTRAGAWKN